MSYRLYRSLCLLLLFSIGGLAAGAQEPLTLRQAINQALGQSPEAAIAHAGNQDAKAGAAIARSALLPQLGFTEDISRGDDPVYVFSSKLRQHRFKPAVLHVKTLNMPQSIVILETRFSGLWMAFDLFKTQKEIHGADLFRQSASSS